jgi:hypothetical protein
MPGRVAETKKIQVSRIKQRHNIRLSFDRIYAGNKSTSKQLLSLSDGSNRILNCDAG